MPAETSARRTDALQKEWWLRVLMVLQSPKSVFQAMRDDSDEAAEARLDDRLRSPDHVPERRHAGVHHQHATLTHAGCAEALGELTLDG